ncbi:MAG: tetratricopeptide repeat protein [Candidatus Zixiibacteriota bacterium]
MKSAWFLFVLFAVVAAFWTACSENPALQKRYQAEKMYFQAERESRQARVRPELTSTAASHQLRSQYRAALEFCYQALGTIPPEVYPVQHEEISDLAWRAATRISQISYAQKEYDSSIAVLRGLMRRISLSGVADVSAHLNLGRALQANGQWDSALAVFSHSVERFYPPADKNGEVLVGLFNLPNQIYDGLLKAGDTAAAMAQASRAENYYRRLITEFPGGNLAGVSHLNLASLYERLGRYQEAVIELSQLTDTTGSIATPAYLRIALLHADQLGRPDLALEEYERILSRLKGRDTLQRPLVLYNKGLIHLHRGDYDQARQILVDIKKNYPRFYSQTPTVQYAIARSFDLQNRWERAETEYKYVISGFPGSEQSMATHLYLIDQYARQGRATEADRLEQRAEAECDEIVATRPNSRAVASAMSYKAELYRRRQDWQKAAHLLTEVFDKYPTSEIGFRAAIIATVIYRDELRNEATADSLMQVLKKRLTTVDETGEI